MTTAKILLKIRARTCAHKAKRAHAYILSHMHAFTPRAHMPMHGSAPNSGNIGTNTVYNQGEGHGTIPVLKMLTTTQLSFATILDFLRQL